MIYTQFRAQLIKRKKQLDKMFDKSKLCDEK